MFFFLFFIVNLLFFKKITRQQSKIKKIGKEYVAIYSRLTGGGIKKRETM